jgi:hypothetical protein
LQRKTSSVVGPKKLLTKTSSKTGQLLKQVGSSVATVESTDEADGSPRVPAAIQFTPSNISHEGRHDSDIAHGE